MGNGCHLRSSLRVFDASETVRVAASRAGWSDKNLYSAKRCRSVKHRPKRKSLCNSGNCWEMGKMSASRKCIIHYVIVTITAFTTFASMIHVSSKNIALANEEFFVNNRS